MSYEVTILADSITEHSPRLTTWRLTFPRFLLAEVNTHRMLSRNSASSRAIPPEQQIDRVLRAPFIPEVFNKRVKGMGVGEAVDEKAQAMARRTWIDASIHAADAANHLLHLGLDKSRINRLLEPFLWHTAIVTGTEWEHFFALRDHPGAQPEFQILASAMHDHWLNTKPRELLQGDMAIDPWHRPGCRPTEAFEYLQDVVLNTTNTSKILTMFNKIAVGRLARVSFDTHLQDEPWQSSIDRSNMLEGNGHFSPFEHVARPFTAGMWVAVEAQKAAITEAVGRGLISRHVARQMCDSAEFSGNLRGWVQMRKNIPDEDAFHRVLAAQAAYEQANATPSSI